MKKRKRPERPLINLILILFYGLAMFDSGGMTARALTNDLPRAILAAVYFIGSATAFVALLMNRRTAWLWLLVNLLLGAGLAYLISIRAFAWIIGITVMLTFWCLKNNRKWHRIKF